jgi:hypothetical protein
MKRLCLIVLMTAIVCMAVGCKCTPPERITKAIGIINAGTTDYVTHCQPLLAKKIEAMNEAIKAETDEAKKAELTEALKKEIEYFKLGKEIPPTTQELQDWAEGKPLPEDGG